MLAEGRDSASNATELMRLDGNAAEGIHSIGVWRRLGTVLMMLYQEGCDDKIHQD